MHDDHALAQYQQILQSDPGNERALSGAGEAAFHLARYRIAQGYLQSAVRADSSNLQARQFLETANLVLHSDPFAPRISDAERNRRVRSAFLRAGDRLDSCAKAHAIDLSPQSPSSGMPSLKAQWLGMKSKLARRPVPGDGMLDQPMDLVFEIERQTQIVCGSAEGLDQALLLISQDHAGVR